MRRLKRAQRPETVYREIIDNAAARAAAALPAAGSNVTAIPYRDGAVEAAVQALDALNNPPVSAPHDEATLREGDEAIARIAERRSARDFMLSDDELDRLWVAVRRTPRDLTLREQGFLAHFRNTPDSWAESYETTTEYRASRRLEVAFGKDASNHAA
jgi:hypothetical protein